LELRKHGRAEGDGRNWYDGNWEDAERTNREGTNTIALAL
jgi:hypothetical protein